HHLYIVSDSQYALNVKKSLQKKFGEEVFLTVFHDAESSLEGLRKSMDKPHLVLLDYEQNKKMPGKDQEYVVNIMQNINPDTKIIILADEKNREAGARVLAHGAHGFVIKDQFALEHINAVVEKCFHPALM
ncbi:MAG TPA: hypothetical protein VNX68_12555, partial [Nitrosopumilaceae archaeon]|nr:hypothetical protein [Nitrosopumilaceae archaeon]